MLVQGDSGNGVTINDPTGTTEVLFYNKLTVNFTVTKGDPPWIYTGTTIYLDNLAVDSTSEGLGSPFVKTYYPEGYAGAHFVRVEAHFVKGWQDTEDKSDTAGYIVKNAVNTTNLEYLRIDKLHDYETDKGYLDGSGVTICIIEDRIGCNNITNSFFNKSLYRTCHNDLYEDPDRKFVDIKYYEFDFDSGLNHSFAEFWDEETDTREEKWEELFEEGKNSNYSSTADVHGTYVLATLRQIAPAANFVFVATNDSIANRGFAVEWVHDNLQDLGIDIISIAWPGYEAWEYLFDDIAGNGTITVHSAGNNNETFTYYNDAKYPCSFDNTIGVTGVFDGDHGNSSERWKRGYVVNSGYGVDITSICNATTLDWSPVPGGNEFNFTSNACPVVAGILALLEQYQINYKSGTDLTVSLTQILFEETGDEPGNPPNATTTVGGYYDWINENNQTPYYPDFPYENYANYTFYCYGWGLIDGYEMFSYFKNNY